MKVFDDLRTRRHRRHPRNPQPGGRCLLASFPDLPENSKHVGWLNVFNTRAWAHVFGATLFGATPLETLGPGELAFFLFRLVGGCVGSYWIVLMQLREEFAWLWLP